MAWVSSFIIELQLDIVQ